MKTGLQLMGLAVVLVVVALLLGESSNERAAANAGSTAIAACVAGIIGAVMVSRALMDRND
jgi:hypothetical protein